MFYTIFIYGRTAPYSKHGKKNAIFEKFSHLLRKKVVRIMHVVVVVDVVVVVFLVMKENYYYYTQDMTYLIGSKNKIEI